MTIATTINSSDNNNMSEESAGFVLVVGISS